MKIEAFENKHYLFSLGDEQGHLLVIFVLWLLVPSCQGLGAILPSEPAPLPSF